MSCKTGLVIIAKRQVPFTHAAEFVEKSRGDNLAEVDPGLMTNRLQACAVRYFVFTRRARSMQKERGDQLLPILGFLFSSFRIILQNNIYYLSIYIHTHRKKKKRNLPKIRTKSESDKLQGKKKQKYHKAKQNTIFFCMMFFKISLQVSKNIFFLTIILISLTMLYFYFMIRNKGSFFLLFFCYKKRKK